MKLHFPTETMKPIISRGKTSAPDLISRALQGNADKSVALLKTYSKESTKLFRETTLLNQDIPFQFYMPLIVNNTLTARILTDAHFDPQDNHAILASLSDKIGQAVPVRFSPDLYFSSVTTLVSKEMARKERLIMLDSEPDTLNIPPSLEELGVMSQATFEHLSWADTDHEDKLPAIVAHTFLFPLTPGIDVPDNVPLLTHEFPDSEEYHPIRTWQKAITYMYSKNEGYSVTVNGILFEPTQFEGESPFDTLTILPSLTLPTDKFSTLCPIKHPRPYTAVTESVTALTNGIWYHYGAEATPTPTPSPATTAERIQVTVNTPEVSTKSDKEQKLHALNVQAKWEISFGSEDPDNSLANPAPATEAWIEILSKSNKTTALRLLQEHIEIIIRDQGNADNRIAAHLSLRRDHVTSGLLSCIRNFQVFTEMPMKDISGFKTSFSAANLLPIIPTQHKFKECVDECNSLLHREYTTADIKDQSRGTLYYGRLQTMCDVFSMISNYIAIFESFFPGFKESFLYKQLREYYQLLYTPEVQDWLNTYEQSNPQVRFGIFQDVIQITGAFFKVGNHPDNVRIYLASPDKTLSADAYSLAVLTSKQCARRLMETASCARLGIYGEAPTTLMTFLGHHGSGQSEKRHLPSGTPSKPTKNQKPSPAGKSPPSRSSPPDRNADANREKGILIYTENPKPDKIPYTNVRAKKNDNSTNPNQLCVYFMTRGYYCHRGASCDRPHITNIRQLKEEDKREALIKFVADRRNKYSWAPGHEPATGNST